MSLITGSPVLTQFPIPVSNNSTERITEVFIKSKEVVDNTPENERGPRRLMSPSPEPPIHQTQGLI